jgi:hypothetical protein
MRDAGRIYQRNVWTSRRSRSPVIRLALADFFAADGD